MLSDQETESITKARLSVARTVPVRRWSTRSLSDRRRGRRDVAEFFDRTQADAVGFAQGATDGPGFRNAHFCPADEWRNVRRVGIAVTDKAFGAGRCICRGLEDPSIGAAFRQPTINRSSDSSAPTPFGDA